MTDLKLLCLGIRTLNVLAGENINCIEQLLECSHVDLLKMPNMGKKSAQEVADAMEANGLKLRAVDGPKIIANPNIDWPVMPAMSLRDYFAAKALMPSVPGMSVSDVNHAADLAYAIADAMIAARNA